MGTGRAEIGQIPGARGVQDAEARAGEGLDRRLVDGARTLGAAEDEHHLLARPDPEPLASGLPVGGRRRPGAPGDQVAGPVAAGEREGEADAASQWRQQAVGQPQVAVCLHQHERHAPAHGGEPHRARDVPAGAERRRRIEPADEPAGRGHRAGGHHHRAGGRHGVAPRQLGNLEGVHLITGRRDQLTLGPLATDEDDPGALLT